jgi:hypothetical protein
MINWYVEFETWAEGKIEVPWPYVVFEETDNYRSRSDLTYKVSDEFLQATFMTFNEKKYYDFFDKYVSSMILGIELPAQDENHVKSQIVQIFGYCEFHGICMVNSDNEDSIKKVMAGAVK